MSVRSSIVSLREDNERLRLELLALRRTAAEERRPFPVLEAEHVRGATLYASRQDLVLDDANLKGGVIAEVGVGLGDFSNFLLRSLEPRLFVAFDTFKLHELPVLWGTPTKELFGSGTHKDQYSRRFSDVPPGAMQIVEGPSHETLARFPDEFFDMVYIDAGHTYEEVWGDASVAASKIKSDGMLIFNDYIMYDHLLGAPYGIVPVVNHLVVEDNWRVVGFALQHELFCDIAIRRR